MDKDDNKLCDKCGLLPQSPVQPKPPVCKRKKKCCKKDCCENEFAFRKVVIPAALGDDVTGKAKPSNGAYANSYVEYEAGGAQYMYDSYGVYTKIEGGGGGEGTLDFNELENRPKYAGEEMTGETDIPNVNTAVAAEATLREAADTALSGDIAAESLARQNADSGLQTQIDAISASSDVTDIVGTYAELQDYDTSTLSNNDIVKVLQDEEHDNETTYYRWSTATQTFTLIGEEGPYYTKSAADAKFQDKLTAGANVSIDPSTNTISATDTTYNAFTGTDGVDAGTAGLVPAPAVSDAGKYLKADGTWGTVSGGIPTNTTFWGQTVSNGAVNGLMTFNASSQGYDDIMTWTGPRNNKVSVRVLDTSAGGGFIGFAFNVGSGTVLNILNNKVGITKEMALYGQNITELGDPIDARDAANKRYVDNLTISYAALNGTAAPTTATVGKYVGQLYYDTTNEQLYFLKSIDSTTTPATYTWEAVGGGSSVNVVQTTGTSTTDVMSQKAVSNLIYPDGYETSKSRIAMGNGSSAGGNYCIGIGSSASTSGAQSIALGYNSYAASGGVSIGGSTQSTTSSVSLGPGALSNVSNSIALGSNSKAARASELSIGSGTSANPTTRYIANVTDPTLPQDAATKNYCDTQIAGTTETLTIATTDWAALSASDPYDYSATVTATTTISATSTVELVNDQAVLFGTHGFAIGSVDTVNNTLTIYSIGSPSASVSLTIKVRS